ncbi:MAG: hypothetical protein HQL54_00185 [Magnetococcales bacterium]|nr:hypothetical protein [Magnetococcales bacterium]
MHSSVMQYPAIALGIFIALISGSAVAENGPSFIQSEHSSNAPLRLSTPDNDNWSQIQRMPTQARLDSVPAYQAGRNACIMNPASCGLSPASPQSVQENTSPSKGLTENGIAHIYRQRGTLILPRVAIIEERLDFSRGANTTSWCQLTMQFNPYQQSWHLIEQEQIGEGSDCDLALQPAPPVIAPNTEAPHADQQPQSAQETEDHELKFY